jgi:hypothetical protein
MIAPTTPTKSRKISIVPNAPGRVRDLLAPRYVPFLAPTPTTPINVPMIHNVPDAPQKIKHDNMLALLTLAQVSKTLDDIFMRASSAPTTPTKVSKILVAPNAPLKRASSVPSTPIKMQKTLVAPNAPLKRASSVPTTPTKMQKTLVA